MVRTGCKAQESVPTDRAPDVCRWVLLLQRSVGLVLFLLTACFKNRIILKWHLTGLKDKILQGFFEVHTHILGARADP